MTPARTVLSQHITETERRIKHLETEEQTLVSGASLDQLQRSHAQVVQTAQQMDLNAAASTTDVTIVGPVTTTQAPYAPRVLLATVLGRLPSFPILDGAILLIEHPGALLTHPAGRQGSPRLKSPHRVNPRARRRGRTSKEDQVSPR